MGRKWSWGAGSRGEVGVELGKEWSWWGGVSGGWRV